MLSYFKWKGKTNVRREKQKEIEKGKWPTYLGPQAQLTCTAAQPATPSSRLPQAGARTGAWRPCRRRRHLPACLEGLPQLLTAPRRRPSPSRPFPPPSPRSQALCAAPPTDTVRHRSSSSLEDVATVIWSSS